MIRNKIKFYLNPEYEKSGIEKQEKIITFFGMTIYKKTIYHPKLKKEDVFNDFGF